MAGSMAGSRSIGRMINLELGQIYKMVFSHIVAKE